MHSGNINGAVTSNVVRSRHSFGSNDIIFTQLPSTVLEISRGIPLDMVGPACITLLQIDYDISRPISGLVLMYIGLGLISSGSMLFFLRRENARRERGERDEIIGEGVEGDEVKAKKNGRYATVSDAKRDKGDAWSGYRYTT